MHRKTALNVHNKKYTSTNSEKNLNLGKSSRFKVVESNGEKICRILYAFIPGHPENASLKKKAILYKRNSKFGALWDVLQLLFSVIACAGYISETYISTYEAQQAYGTIEMIITQFFLVDFIFNWFVSQNTAVFFRQIMTLVDIITIVPVYITMLFADQKIPSLSLLRFIRILRLIRILRTFKMLGGLSGIKRQLITLSLTLLSLTFVAAGIVQVMENDVKQLSYDCLYVNEYTDFRPSCSKYLYNGDSSDCDCMANNCIAVYSRNNARGEPTTLRCSYLTFFDCFYFIIVTMATVGYGDIHPTTAPSKAVVLSFIITSLVVIPMQVNKLTLLLSMSSAFRKSFVPQHHETHAILCGFVSDRSRLERFFREFFHPLRHVGGSTEYHLVILSPNEPSDDLKTLLFSPLFDARVTYVIGSALSTDDLRRCRADIASGMFFICNMEVESQEAFFDDAATVLRTLSVSNFNPNLECMVQVLRPEDRDILKDSDVSVILCLDELKTALQAKNAICPGISTLIENLFHTFGVQVKNPLETDHSWITEYCHGARMQIYYVPMSSIYVGSMGGDFNLMAEGIFIGYSCILIGVCNLTDYSVALNPGPTEMQTYPDAMKFYSENNIGIIIAPDQEHADHVAFGMNDLSTIDKLLAKLLVDEDEFSVRKFPEGISAQKVNNIGKYSFNQSGRIHENFKDLMLWGSMSKQPIRTTTVASTSGGKIDITAKSNPIKIQATAIPDVVIGSNSGEIQNASRITDHIIVFGCMDSIHLFVHELRRNLVEFSENTYKPIVIFSEEDIPRWDFIAAHYRDVFYIRDTITTSQGFNASNVRDAHAVVLLASRETVTKVEGENLDAEALFSYLKLEQYVPRHVFFCVELTCPNNMAVLNSSIIRRTEQASKLELIKKKNTGKIDETQTRQIRSVFSTQRKQDINLRLDGLKSSQSLMRSRRNSMTNTVDVPQEEENVVTSVRSQWDVHGTHHTLPVFASGRSYVPSSFDSILCQTFFGAITPILCEKMICGQNSQHIMHVNLPMQFTGRVFMDVYRAFQSRSVLVLAIYRAASKGTESILPYVFTNPPSSVLMSSGDVLFAIGHPSAVNDCLEEFKNPIVRYNNGNLGLASNIQAAITGPFKHSKSVKMLSLNAQKEREEKVKQASAKRGAIITPVLAADTQAKLVVIQKLARGYLARVRVQKMVAEKIKQRHNCAIKIQARFRGAKARSTFQRMKQKRLRTINENPSLKSTDIDHAHNTKIKNTSAAKIQKLFKNYKLRIEEKRALGDSSQVDIAKKYRSLRKKETGPTQKEIKHNRAAKLNGI